MPAKVAARESAGCWMTGMALPLLTNSACQLLVRPPCRVPASAFRPSAKHASGNYHAKRSVHRAPRPFHRGPRGIPQAFAAAIGEMGTAVQGNDTEKARSA